MTMNEIMLGVIICALIFLGVCYGKMYYDNGPIIVLPPLGNITVKKYGWIPVATKIVKFPSIFPFHRWRIVQIPPLFSVGDILKISLNDKTKMDRNRLIITDSFHASGGRLCQSDLFFDLNEFIDIEKEKMVTIQITRVKEATIDHYRRTRILWVREVYGAK